MEKSELTEFEISVLKWLRTVAQDPSLDMNLQFFLQTGESNWIKCMVDIANKYIPDWELILQRFESAGYLGKESKKTAGSRRQYLFDSIMVGRLIPLLVNMAKYRLNVSYPLCDNFGAMDRRIEKIVGESVGGGAGFGERDLDFEFDSRAERTAAIKAIKALKIKGLKTHAADA